VQADLGFDYVVVGGGPAGCAVAARLAESDSALKICLIERGPAKGGLLSDVPLGLALLVGSKGARNYAYQTVPQPALNGRRGFQPRGRGIGGGSLINAMIYLRGQPEDYDSWEKDAGCDGWGWRDVLPFFKRAEHNERGADAYHGVGGPLNVADLRVRNPVAEAFVRAAQQAGLPANPDFNGAVQEGVGFYQLSQKNGARFPAAHGYIRDNPKPNLTVMADAEVTRILFEGRVAIGVELRRGAALVPVRAKAEVIVSAGAFGSPQLLMCSGIGPAAHLRAHGIAVLQDSPDVGGNLQDHLDYLIARRVNHPALVGIAPGMVNDLIRGWREFRAHGSGALTTNVAEAGAFLRSAPEVARPDVQLHFCTAMVADHGRRKIIGRGYSLHSCILRPRSRGTVRLASADMRDAPLIDPQYLSDPDDLEVLRRGVAQSLRILDAPALRAYPARPLTEPAERADESLVPRIRATADTIYHPVGTCRMGSDTRSVLDPRLRVRGVQNLRVVDASIMPTLISGNTAAPSAMIGERAASFIRQGAERHGGCA
jgi:choline dehydrogenase-like flavoprotein